MNTHSLPEIAIIGRPNVGKSTLFNRVLGSRRAIVGEQSGLTRDRHRAEAEWGGRRFVLTDTGGVEWKSSDELVRLIQDHALVAVDTANLVLFIVDGRAGPASIESEVALELRKRGVPTFLVVNKCDSKSIGLDATEFHSLGIDPLFRISAEHGLGVADLLDVVIDSIREVPVDDGPPVEVPTDGDTETEQPPMADQVDIAETPRVAVVGRPNVGKSSLVNALLDDDRVIVSPVSGTTRDAIDSTIERGGKRYVIVDTAGIRRAAKRDSFAETVSVAIARQRMRGADVALLVIDAAIGLSRQDVAIAAEAETSGCGLIVIVNKWDLIAIEGSPASDWIDELRHRMGRINWGLFAFVSAKTTDGVASLLPLVDRVCANRRQRVPTGPLNAMFESISRRLDPYTGPGIPRPKYLTQVATSPPVFVVFTGGGKNSLAPEYRRFLENRLRERFDFSGTPVIVKIRRGHRAEAPSGPSRGGASR